MQKFGKFIVKNKIVILIITLILMIPSIIGYIKTDINYDILTYLPSDIETLKGEKILTEDFKMGAFSIVIADKLNSRKVLELEDKFREIDGVEKVVSIKDLTGTSIPAGILPSKIINKMAKDDSTLIFVTFSGSTSDDKTLEAVSIMRSIVSDTVKIGGMSAMVLDTKELFNSEMLLYVSIATIFCIIVLIISLDSYLVPFLLIANIGIAILFNMGSNIIFGNISYITKAIVAILQLGVTTDFSIFLYHKYEKLKKEMNNEDAMSLAIRDTFISVMGSSLTTIAGFLALCTMKLTMGVDIGLVMAKGVLIGVLCVLTLFPALLLVFDKQVEKFHHKEILPKFTHVTNFVMKHYLLIFIVFIVLLVPAFFAQRKTPVYYKLDESIPENYGYRVAAKELAEKYGLVSQEMILVSRDKPNYAINEMIDKIKKVDGIDFVISASSLSKHGLTEDIIPEDIRKIYQTDKYKMIIVGSNYDIATDELNEQVESVNKIIKEYDENAILAGEGPLMKDLVNITAIDLKNVNFTSIAVIFILMVIVLKSISLPILLVASIEFAIFLNMGVPYFTGTEIPFIASIVIGTIQLGATIDYAILLTTKYLEGRRDNMDKKMAIKWALENSIGSIFVSAMCFFAATIGVGIISQIDMIGSLCRLISRGAIISMLVVIMIVPSLLYIFDKIIMKTTYLKKGNDNMKKKFTKKALVSLLILSFIFNPTIALALEKEETVYVKLNPDGSRKNTLVNEHFINRNNSNKLEDLTDLVDIENINSSDKYTLNNKRIIWNTNGNDIFFQGKTDKNLPIKEEISYKLDGKDIKIDDLLGQSGKVEINIKYKNNSKKTVKVNGKKETLYTPFIIATVTNLSNEFNSNVKVTNGKTMDNGLGYTVVALSTPGVYDSLKLKELKHLDSVKITLDTTKFELPTIYSIATPKVFDATDLDIFDKLSNMNSSINKLRQSMNQLESGSKTILKNLTLISNGSSEISKNLGLVLNSLEKIKNGTVALDDGLTKIVSELNKSKDSFSKMSAKLSEMEKLVQANNSYISGLEKIKTNYEKLASVPLEALSLEQKGQLQALKFTYDNLNLGNSSSLIKVLKGDNEAIKNTITAFKEVSNAIDGLNTYLPKLKEGSGELSSGTTKLKTGFETLNSKMKELSNGTKKLKGGMNTLNSGIKKFNDKGIAPLVKVSNNANNLSGKIKGLSKLSNDYQSFSLKNNSTKSNTKFIMSVEGKEAPKTVKKNNDKETDTFIDRVKNLFK